MVLLARKHGSSLTQGQAAGELCLRIVGTARDGQIVRLAAPKCTVGSAAGCPLRLRAVGVRGVQCVIMRGARGPVARSWSPNTRLNGHDFVDSPLAAGDRLTIGPIEFEILATGAPQTSNG